MDVVKLAADGETSRRVEASGSSGSCSTSTTRRLSRALEVAVIQRRESGDYLQERRLTGAVAADESDPLAFHHREAGAIEQGMQFVASSASRGRSAISPTAAASIHALPACPELLPRGENVVFETPIIVKVSG